MSVKKIFPDLGDPLDRDKQVTSLMTEEGLTEQEAEEVVGWETYMQLGGEHIGLPFTVRHPTPITDDEVKYLVDNRGSTYPQLAEELNISEDRVRRIFRNTRIPRMHRFLTALMKTLDLNINIEEKAIFLDHVQGVTTNGIER